MFKSMQIADVLAVLFVITAAVAFFLGNAALARADDLKAVYWLVIGFVAVRAAVHVAKPGGAKT